MNRIKILKDDITKLKVNAIVNASNSSLLGGGGVDGAIHRAGGKKILDECIKIRNSKGGCKAGEAVITTGGNLLAEYVIHTVGPVWNGGKNNEDSLLSNCYINSLNLAKKYEINKIAFPCISTGIYKFPKERAAKIAVDVILDFGNNVNKPNEIIIVCFDRENYDIYNEILNGKE
jgi:O-acetyl-ADP-ribose deacetylase (regulator of RNase III)